MIYYTPDRREYRNGCGTGGYDGSVSRISFLFGRRMAVTTVDPNKRVTFGIWELRPDG